MSIEHNRAAITARIWQSIAQSGVPLSSIPQDQLDTLVNAIADGMLLAVNDMMDEQIGQAAASAPAAAEGEQTLWEGRPFLSISERYVVTNERVRIIKGLFSRDIEDLELFRLKDVDYSQRMVERMVNIGDITLHSSDASHPEVTLRNIANPADVHEIIRRAMIEARKRYNVGFREEM